jgi:hypothetical protein
MIEDFALYFFEGNDNGLVMINRNGLMWVYYGHGFPTEILKLTMGHINGRL